MASRKDLLKAHKFTSDRLVAALVSHDPDRVDSPLRKVFTGTFASVMIGVLIMAGFGVVGLLNPGNNTAWKEQDSVVVIDSEAGQVFWYRKPTLYPMENITSARLASNGADEVTLKSNSLRGVERGERLGIAGAPGQLPATDDLGFYPAQVCATSPGDKGRSTTLSFGSAAAPAGEAIPVVLTDADNREFLVVDGIAHLVPKPEGQRESPLSVLLAYPRFDGAYGLLSTIPVGTELSPERILDGIEGVGKPSQNPVGKATTVGDLVQVSGSDATYVLLLDGLVQIRPLELKALQAADHSVVEVSSQDAAAHTSNHAPIAAPDLPTRLPSDPGRAGISNGPLCATWSDAEAKPVLSADVTPPEVTNPTSDPQLADKVQGEPGKGALLANASASGPAQAAVLVLQGRRYGIADGAALAALKYTNEDVERTSSAIMRLIPPGLPGGVPLSIDAAGRPPER